MQERRSFSGPETPRHVPARLDSREDESFDDEVREAEEEEGWVENEEETEEEQFEEPERSSFVQQTPVNELRASPAKTPDELSIEAIIKRADAAKEYDIFEDIGAPLAERGDRVTYSIKKNGAHVGSVAHPFSYDKIQEKWGGGTYQVTLRSFLFAKKPGGGYLKSQSKMVADKEEPGIALGASAALPGAVEKGSTMELLATLQQMNQQNRAEAKAELERVREENRLREERLEREFKAREERLEREARERESKAEKEGTSTIMLVMKMMESQQKQAEAAAERQITMLTTLMKRDEPKESKREDRLFDMLLESALDKKSKGESLDAVSLHKMMMEMQEKGYERANEMRELVREEAARLAGRSLPDDDDGEEEKEEPKSTTRMLLDTIAPVLAGLAAQGAQAAPPQAMPVRRPMPLARQLQPRGINPNLPARPVAPGTAAPPAPRPVAAPQPAPRAAAPQAPRPTQPSQPQAPKPQASMVTAPKPQAVKASMKPTKKEIVSEVVINLIGQDLAANMLSGKFDPEGTASRALLSLKDHGISLPNPVQDGKVEAPEVGTARWLLQNYTLDDMKAVAKSKGLPEAIFEYLERFYAAIKATVPAQAEVPAAVNPS